MAYQQKPGQGSLFQNRKRSSDKAPTLKGTALVQIGDNMVTLELAGWERHSDKAGNWISLSVKATAATPKDDSDIDF